MIGKRFRDAKPVLFGHTAPQWVVQEVFVGTDKLEYARVALASDPSTRKTLSLDVLSDRRRFIPVQGSAAA